MFSRNVRQPKNQKVTNNQREANFAKWAVKNKYASTHEQGKTYYQQFFARKRNIKAALEKFFKHLNKSRPKDRQISTDISGQFLDYFVNVLEGGS